MTTVDKLRWALGLVVVFLLILLTGRSNVHYSKRIQTGIETIYMDRLVVEHVIFDLSGILHEKELALATGDLEYFRRRSASENERARDLLADFRDTYLVPAEERTLDRFEESFLALLEDEANLATGFDAALPTTDAERLASRLDALGGDLEVLSQIQLDEGRRQLALGDKAVSEMDLVATIETYVLAAVGILAIVAILMVPRQARP